MSLSEEFVLSYFAIGIRFALSLNDIKNYFNDFIVFFPFFSLYNFSIIKIK
jgi:hypothetical protein